MTKIAIVGTAPVTRDEAPFKDDSWQIWSLGRNYEIIPRVDVWFELHKMNVLDACPVHPDYIAFLKSITKIGGLVLGYPWEGNSNAIIYPKVEIVAEFRKYLTSSIALMLALAIQQKPDEIGIWGVDMLASEEWGYQKACCEYYLGVAEGRKIKVTLPDSCPLLRAERIYALEDTGISREIIIRKNELKKVMPELEAAKLKAEYCRGQMDLLNDMEGRWG